MMTTLAADDFGWCVSGRQGPAVVVEGKVAEGESFERQIGPNLVFRLATEPGGWSIVVTEPGKSDNNNYAAEVYLPLRFDYTLDIQAWHFVDGAQGPGRQRKFQFVLNASDYERVSKERKILLWPYSYPESEVDEAQQFRARSKCGKGKLEIKNVILAEDKDTIRELSFRGEFSLPQ